MENSLDFATQIAKQAGALLLDYFTQTDRLAQVKPDRSVVTEADLAADRLIADAIRTYDPHARLLSEELAPDYLTGGDEGQTIWVVDPLDGTTNFSLGLHYWGVLIACLESGWPVESVQFFPLLNELYTAQRGSGAFLNGKRLLVAPPVNGRPQAFFSCCSRTFRKYQVSLPYKARILGSAAYSLCSIARSTAIISFEATPKVWDLAAGWLLVTEAGGIVETLDESRPFPLRSEVDYARQPFPTLAALTPQLAGQARRQIIPRESVA
jgi:myo-inositol-1(or 4)-monophosphatase